MSWIPESCETRRAPLTPAGWTRFAELTEDAEPAAIPRLSTCDPAHPDRGRRWAPRPDRPSPTPRVTERPDRGPCSRCPVRPSRRLRFSRREPREIYQEQEEQRADHKAHCV